MAAELFKADTSLARSGAALFWTLPRKSRNKSAQGNALGSLFPSITSEPCRGETFRIPEMDEVLLEGLRHRRIGGPGQADRTPAWPADRPNFLLSRFPLC